MHAYAAVQSVVAPLLSLKRTSFPAQQFTVDALRRVWQQRVVDLAQAGYQPLQRQQALDKAMLCPHKLFGPDDRDGVPCCFDRICPFCWGLRAALTFENVLRALERRPDCNLWFVVSKGVTTRRREGERGRVQHLNRMLVAFEGPSTFDRLFSRSYPVSRNPLAVAQAVAWLLPYPRDTLLGPISALLKSLAKRQGVHESRTTGIFRSASSVRQIGQCRRNLIAPTVRLPRDPFDLRFHEAEPLLAAATGSFDHVAVITPMVEKELGRSPVRLAWGGGLAGISAPTLIGRPAQVARPLSKAYRQGSNDGVLCALPRAGYLVFRPARLAPWPVARGERVEPLPALPDVTRFFLPYRGRVYSLQPLVSWVWSERMGVLFDGYQDPLDRRLLEEDAR